jgi:hypothetical protein
MLGVTQSARCPCEPRTNSRGKCAPTTPNATPRTCFAHCLVRRKKARADERAVSTTFRTTAHPKGMR